MQGEPKMWIKISELCPNINTAYSLLTLWNRVLPQKPTGSQLVKKFPAVQGTQRFITAFTRTRHLSLSSPYPPIPLPEDHLNIILPSTPGSPQWSLYLRFPHQNPVYVSPLSICAT